MTVLSVNVNKIAVLRNSRGGHAPDIVRAARTCLDAGAHGITVHPRPDARHVRADDVMALAVLCHARGVEFNLEGNPFAPPRAGYPGFAASMAPFDGMPCGLAARDVLRLEMGYPLYGQDLFEASTALEAGLGWAVAFDKGEFRGRAALLRQRDEGPPAACAGSLMEERRHIPRAHYPVFRGDQLIGEVTSGTFSPILQRGIALAYLWPGDVADVGSEVEVDIRGRRGRATSSGRRSWIEVRAEGRSRRRSGRVDARLRTAWTNARIGVSPKPGLGDQPLERSPGLSPSRRTATTTYSPERAMPSWRTGPKPGAATKYAQRVERPLGRQVPSPSAM